MNHPEGVTRVTEPSLHEIARGDDRAAQGRQGLQAAQLSRLAAVGAREDGRTRRRADSLIEQLPRPLRRAVGRPARASKDSSGTAPARRACASSAARSRSIASSRRRSPSSSAARRRSASCSAWNANEGFTATVAQEGDFIVSDALNHASIIDSMRLAKAISKCTTAVYKHADMDDLRAKLAEAKGAKRRMIWTDGIFSMEGAIAKLPDILQIARDHDAIVVRGRLALDRRAREDGPRHRGAFRRRRRSRRHHVDARQGARRRGGRVRRRIARRSRTISRSARGRSCSRTRCRRRSR